MSGAARRPRGPILDWKPTASTLALIEDVQRVIEAYSDFLPLSLRTIYYRLLGTGKYGKDPRLLGRVGEHVGNARRAGVIPWWQIEDSGVERRGGGGWGSAEEWLDAHDLYEDAKLFKLVRQEGQAQRLLVWCEARGMVPLLSSVADEYGIEVISKGGYDSTTVRHEVGVSTWDLDVPLLVLHVGDLDDDGGKIFRALAEDMIAWAEHGGGEMEVVRLAVTPEQVEELGLPEDPTRRGVVQAEAIVPDLMAGILREAIESRIDEDVRASLLADEERQRQSLLDRFSKDGA